MPKAELITSQQVEFVRSKIDGGLRHPINGAFFKELLNVNLQLMITWRVQKKQERFYPPDPDSVEGRDLVYGQLACEIYKGSVYLAHNIWEDHDDIRAREEIPEREFRVSGEQFFLWGLPRVPVIRCDASVPQNDQPKLKGRYVLIDPFYKVL